VGGRKLAFYSKLHDHQTSPIMAIMGIAGQSDLPRRQTKEVTQEMEPDASASVLNIAPRAGVFA